jgi:hypothetical protein
VGSPLLSSECQTKALSISRSREKLSGLDVEGGRFPSRWPGNCYHRMARNFDDSRPGSG